MTPLCSQTGWVDIISARNETVIWIKLCKEEEEGEKIVKGRAYVLPSMHARWEAKRSQVDVVI